MSMVAGSGAGVMTAEYAAARAQSCALRFRYRTRAEVVLRAIQRFLPASPVRLLDVGAAEGRSLAYMARRMGTGHFLGVECSDELRQSVCDLPANAKVVSGDAMNLPESIEPASWDVVSMLALLEHLDDPHEAAREAVRAVAPGGIVVATTPSPVWDDVACRLGLVESEHHVQRIDRRRLVGLFEGAGLDILDSGRFTWAPVASLPYLKIPVQPSLGLAVDRLVGRIPLLKLLCVNSFVVGRKKQRDEDVL